MLQPDADSFGELFGVEGGGGYEGEEGVEDVDLAPSKEVIAAATSLAVLLAGIHESNCMLTRNTLPKQRPASPRQ